VQNSARQNSSTGKSGLRLSLPIVSRPAAFLENPAFAKTERKLLSTTQANHVGICQPIDLIVVPATGNRQGHFLVSASEPAQHGGHPPFYLLAQSFSPLRYETEIDRWAHICQ
jgi:hypothetical protein